MSIQVNHPHGEPHGETWDTEQLREQFEVQGYVAPYVVVRRKSDGVRGTLTFTGGGGAPRVYYDFAAIS